MEGDGLNFLLSQLHKKKKLYNQFHSKLPDKGASLENQIQELTEKVKQLEVETKADEDNLKGCAVGAGNTLNQISQSNFQSAYKNVNSVKTDKSGFDHGLSGGDSFAKFRSREKDTDSDVSDDGDVDLFSHSSDNSLVQKTGSLDVGASSSGSENLSFKDLKKKFENTDTSHTVSIDLRTDSSSFKTYREISDRSKGIELIEAPYRNPEIRGFKQTRGGVGSTHHQDMTSVKQEAAVSIFTSLKNSPPPQDDEIDVHDLKTKLMKHQKRALVWMLRREQQDPPGGIFADDMGLGKTLVLIAVILKNSGRKTNVKCNKMGGTLVVCPATILHQWEAEIIKHCESNALRSLIYHGPKREKDIKLVLEYDVVITTYNLVLADSKACQTGRKESPLFNINWDRIILDESHIIKNYKSQTAVSVFKLKSTKKWAVTGTPIHNDLKDLYCLLKFLQCKPFDDYTVWKKLVNEVSERSVERRNALVKSILLRRCKDEVDENGVALIPLPMKRLIIHPIKLADEERRVYDKILTELRTRIADHENKKGVRGKRVPGGSAVYLVCLLKLQQCCNHLSLLKSELVDDTMNNSTADLLSDFSSLNIDSKKSLDCSIDLNMTFINQGVNYTSSERSTKTKKLIDELSTILKLSKQTEKCVVVSQWVSMLNIIAVQLEEANIGYHLITGSVKAEERGLIAKDFNENPNGSPVLLLSLKAGGVGLNLVGGNHLFLMDIHWNPALEAQACDRIHRVGQIHEVYIHKFICEGTIEEHVLNLQEKKKELASTVLNGAKNVNQYLTFEDIKEMFGM